MQLLLPTTNRDATGERVQLTVPAQPMLLIKSGEGSRGGKVIGHTKSGRPIYGTKSSKLKTYATGQDIHTQARDHAAHTSRQYSLADHDDAYELHTDLAHTALDAGNQDAHDAHSAAAGHHAAQSIFGRLETTGKSVVRSGMFQKGNPHRDPARGTYIGGGAHKAVTTDLSDFMDSVAQGRDKEHAQ